MQDTSVTAEAEDSQSFVSFEQMKSTEIYNGFVSNRTNSDYGKHTPQSLTFVQDLTPLGDIKEDINVRDLPVVMLSDTMGYVTSPGFDENQKYPNNYDGAFNLSIATNESVLINLVTHRFPPHEYRKDYLEVASKAIGLRPWHFWGSKINIEAYVLRESLYITFHSDSSVREQGFKMMFAILPRSQEPKQLPSRLFNCSVPSFQRFGPVFECNLLKECEGGEDEHHCAYRENDCGIEDTIDAGTKCYSLVLHQKNKSWSDAHKVCTRRGQKLATFGNSEEIRQFKTHVPPVERLNGFFVGAHLLERMQVASIKALYRNIWQWVDRRTVFSIQIDEFYKTKGSCALYSPWFLRLLPTSCYEKKMVSAFVCEFYKQGENLDNVTLASEGINVYANPSSALWHVSLTPCPLGHVTRTFLSCDPQTDCSAPHSAKCTVRDVTVSMFVCQRSRLNLHYTLVCDHMPHCSDNSDEDFCTYPTCPSTSLKCENGQCIHVYQQCDGRLDCYDGSDEVCLPQSYTTVTTSPPGSIYLDGKGNFRLNQMNESDECPPTHFLCPRGFCLPVYLRCNGIDDCFGREDEVGCDTYMCRGFYRCRGSEVCLHADNVCDDVPQCPEQDDEMSCDLVCHEECHCQGLAFVCTTSFPVASYVSLRYLDASGSNLTLSDVRNNVQLIVLRLVMCYIASLPLDITFPNLRELDLSWNNLYRLHLQHFRFLQNLKELVVMGNPLVKITSSESTKLKLERVDLSHTSLEVFTGNEFPNTAKIKKLNISWSKLKWVAEDSFHTTPSLESLDIRGCHLNTIPKNVLRNLRHLKFVNADNYKICCQAMLPVHFDLKNCHSTHDLLASCDDLLKSNAYRIFLWIFAVLSLVGNLFSVGARLSRQQENGALGSFGVFVANLSVADLFMGIYLTIIGTADLVYRGRYLWRDDEWKTSVTCSVAGFLCLLSSETSAFIICLITLDRFLVLRFPFGRFHFGCRSALVASGAVWVVGIALAIIPLLPMTRHWEFYSQTGICIPLPFTGRDFFLGYDFSFGVSILLNLVLFVLIAVGQAVVYWAVQANSVPSSTDTQTRDAAIARRLVTVVVSDFLCWFPIGLLGLLASTGTPIPGALNVAVAIFVLPVNSALNPFLYTLNLLTEKRRKAQNEKWLKRLELERRGQKAATKGKSRQVMESVDKFVVIQQIKTWIAEQVLTSEDLLSCSLPVSD